MREARARGAGFFFAAAPLAAVARGAAVLRAAFGLAFVLAVAFAPRFAGFAAGFAAARLAAGLLPAPFRGFADDDFARARGLQVSPASEALPPTGLFFVAMAESIRRGRSRARTARHGTGGRVG
jgi:hypothetical protein